MVHFARAARAFAPKGAQEMVAATIRTVSTQPDPAQARETWRRVADSLRGRFPRVAALLDAAKDDVLAYLALPREHWRQIWSNNPHERVNKEIKRRSDVVGSFPNTAATLCLLDAILAEQHDERQVGRKYFGAEGLARLDPRKEGAAGPRADPPARRCAPPAEGRRPTTDVLPSRARAATSFHP